MRIVCDWGKHKYVVELSDICAALVDIKSGEVWYHLTGVIFVQDAANFPAEYDKQTVEKIKTLIKKAEKLREPIYEINKEYKRKFGYSADIYCTTLGKVIPKVINQIVQRVQESIDNNEPMPTPAERIRAMTNNGFIKNDPPKLTWSFDEFDELIRSLDK